FSSGGVMSVPVLTYFDFPGGRGEEARLAFHIAGVEWKDDRFSGNWPEAKAKTPFGGLPTLEVPGKGVLSQSNAIMAYIGREYGLLPADSFESARHEAILCAVEERRAEATTTALDDEDAKRAAREWFAEGYLARWLANAEAQVKGPFVGGDTLSVADLKLFVILRAYINGVYDHIPASVLDPCPKLRALYRAVGEHLRWVDWYADSRREADSNTG